MDEEKYINYEGLSRFYYLMSLVLATKANKQDVYSKILVDNIIGDLGNLLEEIEGVHYTQEEIDNAQEGDNAYGKTTDDWKIEPLDAIPHTVKSLIDTKADKTETYTREEILDLIDLLDLSKVNTEDLAQIAFSGSYEDLINTPTIPPAMTILSYGSSTWQDFINAYNSNTIVYCRASSNSNPATGNQGRMAFMAYLGGSPTNPTDVEFLYYRSVSSKSSTQQGDLVYIYKLTSTDQWTVTVRETSSKIKPGTGLTSTYNNGVLTLNVDSTVIPSKTDLATVATTGDYDDLINKPDLSLKADVEDVVNLLLSRILTAVNITTDTSSSCSITGVENSDRGELIIYKNNSDLNLVVTVPTVYFTPSGLPIELICRVGGYCEVNYINIDGNIYARGV